MLWVWNLDFVLTNSGTWEKELLFVCFRFIYKIRKLEKMIFNVPSGLSHQNSEVIICLMQFPTTVSRPSQACWSLSSVSSAISLKAPHHATIKLVPQHAGQYWEKLCFHNIILSSDLLFLFNHHVGQSGMFWAVYNRNQTGRKQYWRLRHQLGGYYINSNQRWWGPGLRQWEGGYR